MEPEKSESSKETVFRCTCNGVYTKLHACNDGKMSWFDGQITCYAGSVRLGWISTRNIISFKVNNCEYEFQMYVPDGAWSCWYYIEKFREPSKEEIIVEPASYISREMWLSAIVPLLKDKEKQ
jgi:hypothetical protein